MDDLSAGPPQLGHYLLELKLILLLLPQPLGLPHLLAVLGFVLQIPDLLVLFGELVFVHLLIGFDLGDTCRPVYLQSRLGVPIKLI